LAIVDWDATGASMTGSIQGPRIFMAKNIAGMCGVGKFMKRQKQRDNDLCPHCGLFEEGAHVWICREQGADDVWNRSIVSLQQWLNGMQTDPDLIQIVVQQLSHWRHGAEGTNCTPAALRQLLHAQHQIGWGRFFDG